MKTSLSNLENLIQLFNLNLVQRLWPRTTVGFNRKAEQWDKRKPKHEQVMNLEYIGE